MLKYMKLRILKAIFGLGMTPIQGRKKWPNITLSPEVRRKNKAHAKEKNSFVQNLNP